MTIKPLVFSVDAGAPCAADLAAEQQRIDRLAPRLRSMARVLGLLAVLSTLGWILAITPLPLPLPRSAPSPLVRFGLEAGDAASLHFLFALALFAGSIVFIATSYVRFTLGQALVDRLNPMGLGCCTQVLSWCQAHPALAAYQAQVVSDRLLVQADFEAMKRWIAEHDRRISDATRQAACAALKTPVRSDHRAPAGA